MKTWTFLPLMVMEVDCKEDLDKLQRLELPEDSSFPGELELAATVAADYAVAVAELLIAKVAAAAAEIYAFLLV